MQCSLLKLPSVKRPSRLIGQFSQIPKDNLQRIRSDKRPTRFNGQEVAGQI